jgi:hypothetical protein
MGPCELREKKTETKKTINIFVELFISSQNFNMDYVIVCNSNFRVS